MTADAEIGVLSYGRTTQGYPTLRKTLGKTQVWAITHGLERESAVMGKEIQLGKLYLSQCREEVANDVFLIEGILNTMNPPCKVSKHNKHIPCGPEMKSVDEKQVVE